MDSIQQQIADLSQKVAVTHQAVERLYHIVTEVLLEVRDRNHSSASAAGGTQAHAGDAGMASVAQSLYGVRKLGISNHPSLHHKDVLEDDDLEGEATSQDTTLAPEMQVRRLTAQLTAAYNRIAALEEQLLAKRVYRSQSLGS